MKTLQTTFGIDKAAGSFSKGRNGQQHIAELHVGLERTESDHHFSLVQCSHSLCSGSTVPLGFGIEQHYPFETTSEHLRGIHSTFAWHGLRPLGTHGVGGFSKVPNGGTRVFANPLCQ